jgi:hypothetical protein
VPLRSTNEEKDRQRREKALAKEEQARKRVWDTARNAFWRSPQGAARQTKESDQRWFQIEIPLTKTNKSWASGLAGQTQIRHTQHHGHGVVLTEIESEGWELFQAGFIFHQTGQVSRDKLLTSGQISGVTGHTVGVYLFKATDEPLRQDKPWEEVLLEYDRLNSADQAQVESNAAVVELEAGPRESEQDQV